MASADQRGSKPPPAPEAPSSTPPEAIDAPEATSSRGRIRRVLSGSRELGRIVWRDPEHVAERLTLYVTDRYGDESREWAESARAARPDTPVAVIAEALRIQSAQIARIDGAISGTPFFIALAPGYLMYLLQETRMTQRTAALYGRDPRSLQTAAEMLALRGVHPSVDSAATALSTVRDTKTPDRPTARRSLRTWVHSVYLLLVFGGFMSPSAAKPPKQGWLERARAAFSLLLGIAIWVTTWVVPFTFMVLMAWGCETHSRQLGRRALVFYDGEEESIDAAIAAADQRRDEGHEKRSILRTALLFLSLAVPIGFVAVANRLSKTTGFDWVAALGALVALSLVITTVVMSKRS